MNIAIPAKYLVGIDRNSQRIRRLAAFIEERKATGWSQELLDPYYKEFLRRMGGEPPKGGVVIQVDSPKGR